MDARQKLVETGVLRIDQEHETLLGMLERVGGVCAIGNSVGCDGCTLVSRERCSANTRAIIQA
ncbi:MAG TPA: hypothetical protein VMB75_11225, partial [Rhodocyclaceae bacterium]|nr:hypothetical protein [Rhodocyclaceae bacterium]